MPNEQTEHREQVEREWPEVKVIRQRNGLGQDLWFIIDRETYFPTETYVPRAALQAVEAKLKRWEDSEEAELDQLRDRLEAEIDRAEAAEKQLEQAARERRTEIELTDSCTTARVQSEERLDRAEKQLAKLREAVEAEITFHRRMEAAAEKAPEGCAYHGGRASAFESVLATLTGIDDCPGCPDCTHKDEATEEEHA